MIRSMTGFGTGHGKAGEEEIAVEIRSVNSKFCEVKMRLPRELGSLENDASKQVKARLTRGGIEVSVRRMAGERATVQPRVDLALAQEYATLHEQLARELELPVQKPTVSEILAAEGVLTLEERAVDLEQAEVALTEAMTVALGELTKMREREGKALAEDLLARATHLRDHAAAVAKQAPRVVQAYRERLAARIKELLADTSSVDPGRLAQEVAIFADKADVAEELTRLSSHLDQFEKLVLGDEPAGRRMEFLVQEMMREVNTTGSKSPSADIANVVVEAKAELERIREQVANVE